MGPRSAPWSDLLEAKAPLALDYDALDAANKMGSSKLSAADQFTCKFFIIKKVNYTIPLIEYHYCWKVHKPCWEGSTKIHAQWAQILLLVFSKAPCLPPVSFLMTSYEIVNKLFILFKSQLLPQIPYLHFKTNYWKPREDHLIRSAPTVFSTLPLFPWFHFS